MQVVANVPLAYSTGLGGAVLGYAIANSLDQVTVATLRQFHVAFADRFGRDYDSKELLHVLEVLREVGYLTWQGSANDGNTVIRFVKK